MKWNLCKAFLVCVLLISCTENTETNVVPLVSEIHDSLKIPNETIARSTLNYNPKVSLWTLNGELYSGYSVSFYRDSLLLEKFGILNGRKQNQAITFYPDGHHKQIANYHKGKLHGEKKRWSSDSTHILISHLNYFSGKLHGEQKKWYPSGELFKKLNLNMGKEEGIQQAFRKNGDLFANYEAINGRIFGLKKAALCFGIEDKKIVYED